MAVTGITDVAFPTTVEVEEAVVDTAVRVVVAVAEDGVVEDVAGTKVVVVEAVVEVVLLADLVVQLLLLPLTISNLANISPLMRSIR